MAAGEGSDVTPEAATLVDRELNRLEGELAVVRAALLSLEAEMQHVFAGMVRERFEEYR
jgi:hypothetical protein